MRSVDAHLAKNLEALTHDMREVVQNLGEIAAGLALNRDGGHKEADVEQRDALGQLIERFFQRQTEVLLIERLLELRSNRVRHFIGHPAHAGLKGMSGTDR